MSQSYDCDIWCDRDTDKESGSAVHHFEKYNLYDIDIAYGYITIYTA